MRKLLIIYSCTLVLLLRTGLAFPADKDEDTIPDAVDNCPLVYNADQLDDDKDQVGNACETFFYFDSEPGERIGGGQDLLFTIYDSAIIENTLSENHYKSIWLTIRQESSWHLHLDAPGDMPLTVGIYEDAQRYISGDDNVPGLSFSGDGRGCGIISGEFEIFEITHKENGRLDSFVARFVQYCDDQAPALRGIIHYTNNDDGIPANDDNCPSVYYPEQLDTDEDGWGDVCDRCPYDSENDIDGDNICNDVDNCPFAYNIMQTDLDGDGIGDACDFDDDDDGICDPETSDTACVGSDNCPLVSNSVQLDYDNDGVGDACDNCITVSNPDQINWDDDDMGDACDDSDDDGLNDDEDNCPTTPNWELGGTCTAGYVGRFCMDDADCKAVGGCSMLQEDNFPLGGNNIGDACECEGNFDCDQDVDGADAILFKSDFGRDEYLNTCTINNPCKSDFDCDGDVDGRDAVKFRNDFGRNEFLQPCQKKTFCNFAPLPKTGQTNCYLNNGDEIPCGSFNGLGQDGVYRNGVAWPNPRFADNGDETVTDNLTGLMWTKNANFTGNYRISWYEAVDYIKEINAGEWLEAEYCDWRIPNIRELFSLVDYGEVCPALPKGHPFILDNYSSADFWSSTSYLSAFGDSLVLNFNEGEIFPEDKDTDYGRLYLWPVRGNLDGPCKDSCFPAPVARTGQTECYDIEGFTINCSGTGQDGEHQKGITSPFPRFVDNKDGTVNDLLTGLIWTKDAQQIEGGRNWSAALYECHYLDYSGYSDWRMPNIRELTSLIDYAEARPSIEVTHPFKNVKGSYWSSTSNELPYYTNEAWRVDFGVGVVGPRYKNSQYCVWCVRGGH